MGQRYQYRATSLLPVSMPHNKNLMMRHAHDYIIKLPLEWHHALIGLSQQFDYIITMHCINDFCGIIVL